MNFSKCRILHTVLCYQQSKALWVTTDIDLHSEVSHRFSHCVLTLYVLCVCVEVGVWTKS